VKVHRENFKAMYGYYSRQWQYLLPVLFILLMRLCAATEYYVKSQNSSCPIHHCNTLDELAIKYDYARVNNIIVTDTTVYFLNGTHELKRSIVVKEARNLTWVGIKTATSGIRDVIINCTGISGVVLFENVVNLNVTGITFTYCGKVPVTYELPIGALMFSDVFNIQLAWVTVQNSTYGGIFGLNIILILNLTFIYGTPTVNNCIIPPTIHINAVLVSCQCWRLKIHINWLFTIVYLRVVPLGP